MTQSEQLRGCSIWRRLFAIGYDVILLIAVLFLATALILPFSGGTAIKSGNMIYGVYLLLCSYLYFAWQWVHGGQTLGMRAWKIRVRNDHGMPVNWADATKRFFFSIPSWSLLGTGFIWALFDAQGRALHDLWSHTRLDVER